VTAIDLYSLGQKYGDMANTLAPQAHLHRDRGLDRCGMFFRLEAALPPSRSEDCVGSSWLSLYAVVVPLRVQMDRYRFHEKDKRMSQDKKTVPFQDWSLSKDWSLSAPLFAKPILANVHAVIFRSSRERRTKDSTFLKFHWVLVRMAS